MEFEKEKFLILIGQNIRKIRKSQGFSIENLANISGMEPRHLNKIELGQINTSIYQIFKISLKINVEIQEIYKIPQLNSN